MEIDTFYGSREHAALMRESLDRDAPMWSYLDNDPNWKGDDE